MGAETATGSVGERSDTAAWRRSLVQERPGEPAEDAGQRPHCPCERRGVGGGPRDTRGTLSPANRLRSASPPPSSATGLQPPFPSALCLSPSCPSQGPRFVNSPPLSERGKALASPSAVTSAAPDRREAGGKGARGGRGRGAAREVESAGPGALARLANSVSQLAPEARAQMAAPASGKQTSSGGCSLEQNKRETRGAGGGGVGRGLGAGVGEPGARGTRPPSRVEGRAEAEEGEPGEGRVARGSRGERAVGEGSDRGGGNSGGVSGGLQP